MKITQVCFLSIALMLGITGCTDKVNIEDVTLSLLLGIDLNDQGEVEISVASPVFSEDAKEKNSFIKVKSLSIREARNLIDTNAAGVTTASKVQVILVGSKVIQHKNWYSLFDVLYRDPKIRLNADVVFVNGAVSDVLQFAPKNKPRLSIYFAQLIESANFRNVSFRTSLRKFKQMYMDKGITPFAPEVKLTDKLEVSGTTLLTEKNIYKRTLPINETQYLKILHDNLEGQLSLTIPFEKEKIKDPIFKGNLVSFTIKNMKRKVDKRFKKGQFTFNVNLTLPVMITESPLKLNDKTEEKLKKGIEQKLEEDFNKLIVSFQKDGVDPIGFGIMAGAFKYNHWKKIEDRWIEEYKKSNIKVNVKVIIIDKGILR